MSRRIAWGILGTGAMAHKFARGLAALDDADLVAVGSRSAHGARVFAEEFSVPHRHADYESLAEDEDVDVVYVATPNPFHRKSCLLCLRGGKAARARSPSPSTPLRPRRSSARPASAACFSWRRCGRGSCP